MTTPAPLLLRATAVLLTLCSFGCHQPEPGWTPLWRGEWSRVQVEDRWELAVAAAGRTFQAPSPGLLRMTLANPSHDPAEVRLYGSGVENQWQVGAGSVVAVETAIEDAGSYRFEASPPLLLCSPRFGRPLAAPRQVVLVVVDTLRDDHVNTELTPGILAEFADGARFRDATAASSWTLPSMASLFTSRPVLDLSTPEGDLVGVPDGLDTWAQTLEAAGFAGVAIVANYSVHVHNGFGSGFATYLVPDGHGSSDHPDAAWVVAQAKTWLAAHHGENAFLYLHFMDPHQPYRDHSGAGLDTPDMTPLAHRERDATPQEEAALRRLYAGEVRHVDRVLAPWLASLPEHAVVAFTADHGESLGEHASWGHGFTLFQQEISVPLLIRGPGVARTDVEQPAQLVDLASTLLDLAGVEAPQSMLGNSLVAGGSNLPIVSATFAPGTMHWAWRHQQHKLMLRTATQPGLTSTANTTMGLARQLPPGVFFYDLDDDPQELHPLSLDDRFLPAAGEAFAETAGRLVPGVQVAAWGVRGPVKLDFDLSGAPRFAQIWAPATVRVEQQGTRVRLECSEAFPVCAVAVSLDDGEPWIAPAKGTTPWLGAEPGQRLSLADTRPPNTLSAGLASVWLNPSRERVVSAHEETLERLKALGYLQ